MVKLDLLPFEELGSELLPVLPLLFRVVNILLPERIDQTLEPKLLQLFLLLEHLLDIGRKYVLTLTIEFELVLGLDY